MSNTSELIKKLQNLYTLLETGECKMEELDAMVSISRELNERCIILRYKAIEEKVFTTTHGHEENTNVATPLIDGTKPEKAKEQNAAIDFGIFDDLTNEEEQIDETPSSTENLNQAMDQQITDTGFAFEAFEEEIPTPIFATAKAEEVQQVVTPLVEKEEVKDVAPEPVIGDNKWSNYIDQKVRESETGFRSPITSLIGSFGMNERLMYINELYEGNAEAFSDLVKKMDSHSTWEQCKQDLALTAEVQQWDKTSETVADFILHIQRKYV